jgi:hypothetical protein
MAVLDDPEAQGRLSPRELQYAKVGNPMRAHTALRALPGHARCHALCCASCCCHPCPGLLGLRGICVVPYSPVVSCATCRASQVKHDRVRQGSLQPSAFVSTRRKNSPQVQIAHTICGVSWHH